MGYTGNSQSIPWDIVWELPDHTRAGIVQTIPGYSPVRGGGNLVGYTVSPYSEMFISEVSKPTDNEKLDPPLHCQ